MKYNKISFILLILPLFMLILIPNNVSAQEKGNLQEKIQFAKEQVYPALVNISVVIKGYSQGRSRRSVSGGSGVIVSQEGHVITNFHVASDAIRITCTLPTGERIRAEIVGHDPLTDLSVLKLKVEERANKNDPLPHAKLGDSNALEVGDHVLAMGNPFALSSTTTLGIVSNPERVFTDPSGSDVQRMRIGAGELTGIFTRWIQHDALILPGNSGGPLVNLNGEVIGINELGNNGVGFAIPSNLCSMVLKQILENGQVVRGWSGLKILPVNKLKRKTGALIASVRPQSPARRAGLKPGDILISINEKEIVCRFFEQVPLFYQHIASLSPGSTVRVTFIRDGQSKTAEMKLEKMKDYLGPEAEFRSLGLTVREITEPMAITNQYEDHAGVIITGVRPGEIADQAKPSLRRGDVIRKIDDTEIENLETMKTYLQKLDSFETLPVQFRRNNRSMLTVLEREDEDSGISGGQLGKPWMGIETQVLTPPVAKALGHEGTRGFRITRVYPGTEADKAGLKKGDLIVGFKGNKLDAYRTQDAYDLTRRIENQLIGDTVDLTLIRNDEKKTVKVKLEETPETSTEAETLKDDFLEFSVREITYMDRLKKKWDKQFEGVLVSSVKSGGWASLGGLRGGDVILSVQETDIATIKNLEDSLDRIKKEKPEQIKIFVRRGVETHFVFISPKWEDNPGSEQDD